MSDVDDVKAAVATYHAALSSLNIAKIETLWAHDDSVTQLEPTSKAIIHGWKAVKKGLEDFFGGFSEVKISQADGPHVRVKGDAAWATGRTHAVAKTKAGEAMTRQCVRHPNFREARRRVAGGIEHRPSGSADRSAALPLPPGDGHALPARAFKPAVRTAGPTRAAGLRRRRAAGNARPSRGCWR